MKKKHCLLSLSAFCFLQMFVNPLLVLSTTNFLPPLFKGIYSSGPVAKEQPLQPGGAVVVLGP